MAALFAHVDGRDAPAAERLRAGWPRGILVLFVAMPAILAGPIRFVSGASFRWSYVAGTLLSLLALAPFVRALRVGALCRRQELFAHFVTAVVGVFAALLTYNRHFAGLPNYVGADNWKGVDGGYHLMNFMDFHRTSNVYGGFVSMYSFWDVTRLLGSRRLIVGLNVCFIFVRVLVAVVPCAIALAVLHRHRDRPSVWWTGAAVSLVAALAVQYFVVLPLLNFHLMGGFWPPLFGFVPLMLLWLADALVRPRLLRLLSLLAGVLLYRYTYGLNLADLTGAIGALLIVEALGARRAGWWVRVGLVAVAAAAFWSSRYCYLLSTRLFNDWGWIIEHDVKTAWNGQLAGLAAFAVSIAFVPVRDAASSTGVVRALRFPLLFGAANLVFLQLVDRVRPRTFYYFQKYDLHSVVLVASALVVVATAWSAVLVARPPSLRAWLPRVAGFALAVALAATSGSVLHGAIAAYDQGFREQVYGEPYVRSYPLGDAGDGAAHRPPPRRREEVVRRIPGQALAAAHRHQRALRLRRSRLDARLQARSSPGHCSFWDSDGTTVRYDMLSEKKCEHYVQIPFGRMTVCSICN